MMKLIAMFAVLGLAACVQNQQPVPLHEVKQQHSVTEPGMHVSGSARFGVVRNF